jgi:hypothetical protein
MLAIHVTEAEFEGHVEREKVSPQADLGSEIDEAHVGAGPGPVEISVPDTELHSVEDADAQLQAIDVPDSHGFPPGVNGNRGEVRRHLDLLRLQDRSALQVRKQKLCPGGNGADRHDEKEREDRPPSFDSRPFD